MIKVSSTTESVQIGGNIINISKPARELTSSEKLTITSCSSNGVEYTYYQGDEPIVTSQTEPIILNWKGLSQDLFYSPLFQKAMIMANPNAYSTLLKVLTDGENDFASENAFLQAFAWMGVPFTTEEKGALNDILSNNGFTVRV